MKVISIVSTRPDFIKVAYRHKYFKKLDVDEIIINTGQHYDHNMSKVFFDELEIPQPDYNLDISTGLVGQQTGEIIGKVEKILIKENPDVTIVYGDVTSSLATAVACVKLKIPVAHIEGGIRTDSKWNPEDINRKICDHLSDIIFVPTDSSMENLRKENFKESDIFFLGDTTKDILLRTLDKYNIQETIGDYLLLTLHRAENVDNKERLSKILNAIRKSKAPVIFPIHPRTQKRLKEFDLYDNLPDNIKLIEPQSFVNFIKLLAGAKKVLTDSGTVRRESYMLHKPIITLIDIVWWPDIVKCGWNKIVDCDEEKIVDAINNFTPPEEHPEFFGDGHAEEKIINEIVKRYG
jgi:UDP-GlcNAc3NAcA epimerase